MQQVNLYLLELRPKLDVLSAQYLSIFVLLAMGAMGLVQVLQVQKYNLVAVEAAAVTQDVKMLETKIERLKSLPKSSDKSRTEEAVAATITAIHNREYAQQIIQSKNLGNDKGFSSALMALASLSLPEVMLNEFSLSAGGSHIELVGVSNKSSAIPQYMHQLQASSAFANSEFGVLSMHKSISTPGQVIFRLGAPTKAAKPVSDTINGEELFRKFYPQSVPIAHE